MTDGRPVTEDAVEPSLHPGLAGRRLRRSPDGACRPCDPAHACEDGRCGPDPGESAFPDYLPQVLQSQVQVAVDVQFTGDVRLGCPELPRRPQQPADGVGILQPHYRSVGRARLAAVPHLEPDGKFPADHRPQDLGDGVRERRRHIAAPPAARLDAAWSRTICWTSR
ncbi:hypothetical protein D9M72_539570 [compost metagenome]